MKLQFPAFAGFLGPVNFDRCEVEQQDLEGVWGQRAVIVTPSTRT